MALNLPALQARAIPRLDWREIFVVDPDIESDDVDAFDAYFSRFAALNSGKCLNCDAVQGGLMSAVLGNGFQYGLRHGEGFCRGCGYPARANHYSIGPIRCLEIILQYHPDELHERRRA